MNKSCNNFKIWKIIESNCKILCISIFLFCFVFCFCFCFVFFFLWYRYIQVLFCFIFFYNLCFLLTPLKNNPGAATVDSSPISYTHPLKINPHKYREMIEEITIKFGTKLKPTKASWKSQLYRIYWRYSYN